MLIPILYLKGISTGDFEEALAALLGKDAGDPAIASYRFKAPKSSTWAPRNEPGTAAWRGVKIEIKIN